MTFLHVENFALFMIWFSAMAEGASFKAILYGMALSLEYRAYLSVE